MADLQGTEWANRWAAPRRGDETVEMIHREFNHSGTPADSDTLALVKVPAGYSVIDVILEIVTVYEVGTASIGTAELGLFKYDSETGAIASTVNFDVLATTIVLDTINTGRYPSNTDAVSSTLVTQTFDQVMVLTFGLLNVPAAGVLRGVCTMASTGLT